MHVIPAVQVGVALPCHMPTSHISPRQPDSAFLPAPVNKEMDADVLGCLMV